MVTNQASLKRNGVQDFVTIRATAIIMTAFTVYMVWFFLTTAEVTYVAWRELFAGLGMKIFTFATLVSVMMHVRIGLWQVLTDYVKPASLRALLQFVLNLIAFAYAAAGLFVLWGV